MQLNKLIEFRQVVYEQGLVKARDAQFELVDSLLTGPRINSFVELSLSPVHRRGWSSIYAALAEGQQDHEMVREWFLAQVPDDNVWVFSLDGSIWPHGHARTLQGLVLEPMPNKRDAVAAHMYSELAWVPEAHRSWALPIRTERVPAVGSEVQTGIAQVEWLCRHAPHQDVKVIVADGRYGNHKFLGGVSDLPCVVVTRLRQDRVLYREPPPYTNTGRPRTHGAAFRFKDPATWDPPCEDVVFEHERYGVVHLRRWTGLHAQDDPLTVFDVVLAETHLGQATRPEPKWFAGLNATAHPVRALWSWYTQRWPIEPAFRFRKRRLHWTLPQFHHTLHCDRWTLLVDIAYWQLYLARELVHDAALPWQKPLADPTPGRVLAGMSILLAVLPPLTQPPKPRGKSPGWTPGRPRTPPSRFEVVKRGSKRSRRKRKRRKHA